MDDQRLGVAHVGQVREEPQRLDEAPARGGAAADAEDDDAAAGAAEVALGEGALGVAREAGVADPGDLGVGLEVGA